MIERSASHRSRRVRPEAVRALVLDRDLAALVALVDAGAPVLRAARGLLYSEDDLTRERAAEAVAAIAPRLEPPKFKRLLTDLLWTLNDESGMSGRGTPEAVGRILEVRPDLRAAYVPILLAYLEKEEVALNDEILDGGLLAALGRLGSDAVVPGEAGLARLEALTRAPEPRLRGTAAWTIGRLALGALREAVDALRDDAATFPLYRDRALTTPTVGEVARRASTRLPR